MSLRRLIETSFTRRLRLAIVALAGACGAASAANLSVEGGQWFDGERFRRGDWFVVDGKLTRTRPSRIDVRINAAGAFVVPPYADGHNHDMQNAWGVGRRMAAHLKEGVFYSAQLCANEDLDPFRPLFNQPAAPDVVVANVCISSSDGHPLGLLLQSLEPEEAKRADLGALRRFYVAVDDEATLDRRWPELLERKPDLIKVILIDSSRHAERFGKPELLGRNGLDPALLAKIVARAHAAGLRVVAHVDTAADVRAAAEAGVDILAHLPGYHFDNRLTAADYRISDDTVRLVAQRHIRLVATASVSATMVGLKGAELDEVQRVQKDNLERLIAAGVPLLIGSDNPFGGPVDEVAYLHKLGVVSRQKLLKALTMDTPQTLFPGRSLGRIAEGAEGSFLLLDGNPVQDLGFLRRIRLAVKQGQVVN